VNQPALPIDRFEVFATGLDHSECVAFDRAGTCWAGGEAGQIYQIDPRGAVTQLTTLGSFNGGLAFSPDDELFVCNPAKGIVHVKRNGEQLVFASHAQDHKLLTPNFAVFDTSGNCYVTDSGQWKKHNGFLLRFDSRGRGEIVAGPFGYANGLALSGDGRRLFMAETDTNRIYRFDIAADGSVGEAKVLAENVGRMLDGLSLDAKGHLYACNYASDEIWRISPTGEKALLAHDPDGILLGAPTNIAFGGEAFEHLYVANLGRYTIVKVHLGVKGQPLANLREL
jgi:gluconolactonase